MEITKIETQDETCELILHKYYVSWTGFLLAFGAYGVGIRDRLNLVFDIEICSDDQLTLISGQQSCFPPHLDCVVEYRYYVTRTAWKAKLNYFW
jgi:hypothetical protein